MHRKRLILSIFVLLTASAASAQSRVSTIPVFAHFAGWWTVPGQWPIAGSMPLLRDNPAGGYTSSNPEIIKAQNALMAARGVTPAVSWWAWDTFTDDKFLSTYLSIPGPQIGILYEAVGPGRMKQDANGRVNVADPANNAEIFVSDMQHLQEQFFNKYPDRFFRIDGRPVVFIWISHGFDGPFDQIIARARQRASFFLWGSDFGVPFGPRPGMETVVRGMDAITSYSFYDPGRYGIEMPEDFLTDFKNSIPEWRKWLAANAPNTRLILPMQFSYDETRIPNRRGLYFRSSPEMARKYARLVRDIITDPCGSGVLPYGYVTSWNEHVEGSALEPREVSREDQQRGFTPTTYLDAVSDTFLAVSPWEDQDRTCDGDERGKDPAGGN